MKRKADIDFMENAVRELFAEENLDPEDFEVEWLDRKAEIQPLSGYSPEYTVVESYELAVALAEELVRGDLETEPEIFNQSWLMYYINEDRLRDALYQDEYNSIYDDLIYEIERNPSDAADRMGIDLDEVDEMVEEISGEMKRWNKDDLLDKLQLDPGLEYDQDELDDAIFDYAEKRAEENLVQDMLDKLDDFVEAEVKERLADPVEFLKEIFGDEEGIKKSLEWGGIDYERAAEEAVMSDGAGHFLSGYDGVLEELPSGAAYWRTN